MMRLTVRQFSCDNPAHAPCTVDDECIPRDASLCAPPGVRPSRVPCIYLVRGSPAPLSSACVNDHTKKAE